MRRTLKIARTVLLALGAFVLIAAALLLFSLTLRIGDWRSGELPVPPLAVSPGASFSEPPMRLWIDTDAACGHGARTDPDDCLAILLLAQARDIEIVGISTVFGNAPLPVTDRTTRELWAAIEAEGRGPIPILRGAAGPFDEGLPAGGTPAQRGLRQALEEGPLVILALGPATNIAAVLKDRPDLQSNVVAIVAVMGRRWGHLFHPVEGGTAGSFLGHGPVFRDFNVAKDEKAAEALVAMGLSTTYVPYEAARDVMIDGTKLDAMEVQGGAAAWVAGRTRAWLEYWRSDIGRNGFYPFDLVAAAYLVEPSMLRCADVTMAVGEDAGLLGWFGRQGVFAFSPDEQIPDSFVASDADYCSEASPDLGRRLIQRLTPSVDGRSSE